MSVDFRYKHAGYAALNVTNLDNSTEFITETFGLSPAGEGPDGERFFRCGSSHHDVVIYQNDEPGLLRHAWEMETGEDVQKAFRHFEQLNLKPAWLSSEESAVLGVDFSSAFRVREPTHGICYEYYADMLTYSSPLTVNMADFEYFLHSAVNVSNVKAATDFAVENMGYVVSDYLGDNIGTLVRAYPIPDHHSFAFLPTANDVPGLNHIAFKVKSVDDIGKYYNRTIRNGHKIAFGMGRHPTSTSVHTYVFDPDGMSWEYSQGMEQFPEEDYRRARYMSPAPEDFDLWGAVPQPGFGTHGNVVTED